MKPPQKPTSSQHPEENPELEFEQELEEIELTLLALKERYTQVQSDRHSQAQLQERLKKLRHSKLPQMKAQLREIKQRLEVLEINLESQLFSWGSLKEPFWQAVRFGGLGVIIGWLLKSSIG